MSALGLSVLACGSPIRPLPDEPQSSPTQAPAASTAAPLASRRATPPATALPSIRPQAALAGRLAFDNFEEIFVLDLLNGQLSQLTAAAGRDFNAAWSPDGDRIAFRSRRDGNDDIYVMNADGTEPRNITETPGRAEFGPAWSPDGQWIAFNAETHADPSLAIFVMRPDGTGLRRVTARFGEFPSWSPDGRRIAFASLAPGGRGVNPDYDLVVVNADGTGEAPLTATPATYETYPQWSPDGTRIAFMAGPVGRDVTRVHVMPADGADVRELSTGNSGFPAWSPDGRHLAFVQVGRDISVVTATGDPVADLGLGALGGELGFPTWSR